VAYKKRELTNEDLQAFDALIGYLQASSQESINLRQFLAADDVIKKENHQAAHQKWEVRDGATAILEKVFSITLGQLNRDVSLEKLIEIWRSLENKP